MSYQQSDSNVAATVPVRRAGVPDGFANVAAFFASEESGYANGGRCLL